MNDAIWTLHFVININFVHNNCIGYKYLYKLYINKTSVHTIETNRKEVEGALLWYIYLDYVNSEFTKL